MAPEARQNQAGTIWQGDDIRYAIDANNAFHHSVASTQAKLHNRLTPVKMHIKEAMITRKQSNVGELPRVIGGELVLNERQTNDVIHGLDVLRNLESTTLDDVKFERQHNLTGILSVILKSRRRRRVELDDAANVKSERLQSLESIKDAAKDALAKSQKRHR